MSVAEQRAAVKKIVKVINEEVKKGGDRLQVDAVIRIMKQYATVDEEYRKPVYDAMKASLSQQGIKLGEKSYI